MNKILIILIFTLSFGYSDEWQVNKKGDNSVVFHSTTTLLDFKGTTNNIDGYIYWEGDSLFPIKSEIYFEVLPATFNTGLGKRDSDMRRDVLETEKYPVSSFKGKVIKSKNVNNETKIAAAGTLTIHGKTKELTINATLKKTENKVLVESNFSVFLRDFDIDAPSLMAFVKVAQEIKISLIFEMHEIK